MKPLRLLPLLALAACATPPAPVTQSTAPPAFGSDQQAPAYVRRGYETFSARNVVAVTEREWRAFGSVVDDLPPGGSIPHAARQDQQPGLWQRVGDYWWIGQNYGTPEDEWGSKYNQNGTEYRGDPPAWSAAFISYVMRVSGAGSGFPYTPLHADYINAAARGEGVIRAERPSSYAPRAGDMICLGRLSARRLQFEDLPAPRFFGHCDIVTQVSPGQISVVGGNVGAGVTLKHVPTTSDGMLADPSGQVLDGRYPWFVVLRVLYAGVTG